MASLSQADALRAEYERSFFMANRPTLSTTQLGSYGSLQAARDSVRVAAEQGVELEASLSISLFLRSTRRRRFITFFLCQSAFSPLHWGRRYGLEVQRPLTERRFFVPFLDCSTSTESYARSDEYVHLSWEHNVAWYTLTQQLRFPQRGLFTLPRIQRDIERFIALENFTSLELGPEESATRAVENREAAETVDDEGLDNSRSEKGDRAVHRAERNEEDTGQAAMGEEDMTLVDAPFDITTDALPFEHPPSPKRTAPSPPLLLESLGPALKRSRSASPRSSSHSTVSLSIEPPPAEVPERCTSAIPHIAISPPALPKAAARPPTVAAQASPTSLSYTSQPVLLDRLSCLPKEPSSKLKSLQAKGKVHISLRIPRFAAREVIGQSGANIRDVEQKTKVFLQVEDAVTSKHSVVHFAGGTPEERQRALAMVEKHVKKVKGAKDYECRKNLIALT
ncbi:hypothetical protein JCM16303_004452 [Sporobolomyces ruberrimus]